MPTLNRILGVDDNSRNLLILEKTLAGVGDIVTAASGEEALEIAPRYRPDLILLDIMMPGIDGFETCRRLRDCRELAASKIIMVSAKSMVADRLQGYAAGADDFVSKPFDPDELVAKVRVYLRLRAIEQVDRLKGDFLQMLGHQTRTPLTAILAPAELLLADPALDPGRRELVEMMRDGGIRLLTLVERVAYLGQLKTGSVVYKPSTLDLGEIAHGAVVHARAASARNDVDMTLDLPPGMQVTGDAESVKSVIVMLLDNALRVSPINGVVSVLGSERDGWSRLSVIDRGPGLSADLLPRVFDEFVANDMLHHGQALGLSLAMSRYLVEQQGGSLLVENGAASGAMFHVLLPTLDARAQAA